MTKIYCGIGKVPKNKKLGTMKQCAEANQIRYYGIKKIDRITLENLMKSAEMSTKKLEKEILKIQVKIGGIKGAMKRLDKCIKYPKDEAEKKKCEKEYEQKEKDKAMLIKEL